ncbi:MAG: hypothetical protein OXN21_03390, partial [Chloroflexota bacterium]|nr:hypothetical protein [Chloroflexota bacterium]
ETTVFGDVPAVERDLYWEPRTLGEIKSESQEGLPHSQQIGKGEAMTDDNGTETHPPDVVNVEEFLFGGVTEETAEDAPADAEGNLPVEDAAEDPEVDADADAGEHDVADASEEQPAPTGTETAEELKVVLSIKGNRATIGVQQPSADPHIESFDDPDLFGLADEFPAVVARAKARWEEEPMHPAYVKPAPPPRQRNRRQQGTAQAATSGEEAEGEGQQQPGTLRLF